MPSTTYILIFIYLHSVWLHSVWRASEKCLLIAKCITVQIQTLAWPTLRVQTKTAVEKHRSLKEKDKTFDFSSNKAHAVCVTTSFLSHSNIIIFSTWQYSMMFRNESTFNTWSSTAIINMLLKVVELFRSILRPCFLYRLLIGWRLVWFYVILFYQCLCFLHYILWILWSIFYIIYVYIVQHFLFIYLLSVKSSMFTSTWLFSALLVTVHFLGAFSQKWTKLKIRRLWIQWALSENKRSVLERSII